MNDMCHKCKETDCILYIKKAYLGPFEAPEYCEKCYKNIYKEEPLIDDGNIK